MYAIRSYYAIAMMDRLEDDYGLDTIEIGATIGVAMEAGLLKFGDAQGAIELVKEIGKGSVLGRVLGSGALITGKVYGITVITSYSIHYTKLYDLIVFCTTKKLVRQVEKLFQVDFSFFSYNFV